jgi:hypothetical protein
MLCAPDTPDPRLPALLLALLADGSSYLAVHAVGDGPLNAQFRAALAADGRDFASELAQERRVVEATRVAVGAHLPDLIPFLEDPEPGTREALVRALGRYPERAGALLPILQRALAREAEPYLRKEIADAIRQLRAGAQAPAP